MRAKIIMVFDGEEYEYGTYKFDSNEERNRVNELAMQIRDERGCGCYIQPVEE